MSWFTVTPLHNITLPTKTRFEFGPNFVLSAVPEWLRNDTAIEDLGRYHRGALGDATHAFVVSYEADGLGSPDPDWDGPVPRSMQDRAHELSVLANLALWLAQPSPVCFILVFHSPNLGGTQIIQDIKAYNPLLCHRDDLQNKLDSQKLIEARKFFTSLASVPRMSAAWTAVRATWSALQMDSGEIRYMLFWIALEALFGPEDAREMTYRLSERLALFLGSNTDCAVRSVFSTAKKCYGYRSKIAHGRWKNDSADDKLQAQTEWLIRFSMRSILLNSQLIQAFSTREREAYLDSLVFGLS